MGGSYGHLLVITGYFSGIIHVINGVFLVLITGISGHNCNDHRPMDFEMPFQTEPCIDSRTKPCTQCGAPKRYRLLYKPHEYYSYLHTINHSYWSYLHQLNYRLGAPLCKVLYLLYT